VGRETLKVDTTPRRVGASRPGTGTGRIARCARDQTGNQAFDVRGTRYSGEEAGARHLLATLLRMSEAVPIAVSNLRYLDV
jgi:hypothetical protein